MIAAKVVPNLMRKCFPGVAKVPRDALAGISAKLRTVSKANSAGTPRRKTVIEDVPKSFPRWFWPCPKQRQLFANVWPPLHGVIERGASFIVPGLITLREIQVASNQFNVQLRLVEHVGFGKYVSNIKLSAFVGATQFIVHPFGERNPHLDCTFGIIVGEAFIAAKPWLRGTSATSATAARFVRVFVGVVDIAAGVAADNTAFTVRVWLRFDHTDSAVSATVVADPDLVAIGAENNPRDLAALADSDDGSMIKTSVPRLDVGLVRSRFVERGEGRRAAMMDLGTVLKERRGKFKRDRVCSTLELKVKYEARLCKRARGGNLRPTTSRAVDQ